ncbi:MAG: hypothetical protein KDG50_07055 [Chromatiales bacterium]|nr:hypothetical protein [Chromatiales bacterium]
MLRDFKPETRGVKFSGGSFEVRGISLEDLAVLVRTHLPDLETLFQLFERAEEIDGGDLDSLAAAVFREAPGFVANVIALAAGEPDEAPTAQLLPFPVQVQVIKDVAELTFSEVGGVKKFLTIVASMLGSPTTIGAMRDKISKGLAKATKAPSFAVTSDSEET